MGKMSIKPSGIRRSKKKFQYFRFQRQKDIDTSDFVLRAAPDWWEKEVKGIRQPILVCERCGAIYYDEHWHTWSNIQTALPPKYKIKKTTCFECLWIERNKQGRWGSRNYEGEVLLKGLIPGPEKQEIIRLIRKIGKRATLRDPEDQIIKIEDKGKEIRITTTENQLAVSIGKQVFWARKGGELKIIWSHEDAPTRVIWTHK